MRGSSPRRVLIVAHKTADSPELLAAVSRRAAAGLCTFTLLVPARSRGGRLADGGDPSIRQGPDRLSVRAAENRLEAAIPLLSQAAGEAVLGVVGAPEPLVAVEDALTVLGFDEVMISMLPVRESRWFRLDLPRKVRALGVPVTEIISTAREPDPAAA